MNNNKYKELLNRLIDDYIDIYGINETIVHLYNIGASVDELIELGFDKNDILNMEEI